MIWKSPTPYKSYAGYKLIVGWGEGKGQTREGLEAPGDLGGRVDQETEEVGWGGRVEVVTVWSGEVEGGGAAERREDQ